MQPAPTANDANDANDETDPRLEGAPEYPSPLWEPAGVRAKRGQVILKPGMEVPEGPPGPPPGKWTHLVGMLALAGAAYPPLLAAGFILFAVPWLALTEPTFDVYALGGCLGGAVMFGGCGVWVGLIVSALVSSLFCALVRLYLRSVDWTPRWDRLGVFCGGLIALLCLGWPFCLVERGSDPGWIMPAALVYFAAGPGLGTIVGQSFGGLAGINNLAGHTLAERTEFFQTHPPPAEPFRFSLMHAMWLTTWICVGLGLARVAGAFSFRLIALACLWLPFQMVTSSLVLATLWSRERRRLDACEQRPHVPRDTTVQPPPFHVEHQSPADCARVSRGTSGR
ncbi:hypothetical protein Pla175_45570 [Pirellulimonas nuda]|uniref:Uncharacterized protein n=1 Tax=Pirellulimonas nuda TaxID=2528009 RepID=A0A518DI32_9BACT|nr:hypothetical protein [Pirellulimonas nuda]QDU91137.1 hypothetical protein Pla175_45570 [Pirellulimonas nuda]